jgi:hypothetical protein
MNAAPVAIEYLWVLDAGSARVHRVTIPAGVTDIGAFFEDWAVARDVNTSECEWMTSPDSAFHWEDA